MDRVIEKDFEEIIHRVNLRKIHNKKILVTGASGLIGQYIVGAISHANKKSKVKCTIDAVGLHKPPRLLASILSSDSSVTYRRIDLSKQFRLSGYDYIFHAGGYGQPAKFVGDPSSVVKVNVDASMRLLDASPQATFIYFSSGAVYGDVPARLLPVKEDFNGDCELDSPRAVYTEAKRLGESFCAAHEYKTGTKTKIVRISHVYGPGLPSSDRRVMSDFIRKAFSEKKIELLDQGKAVKTYGYIADVAAMILFVGFHGKQRVYNVGGIDTVSILNLAKQIASYCNASVAIPSSASHLGHIGRDPKVVMLDLNRITREMPKFSFTPFSNGLARTIEWARLESGMDH